MQTRWFVLALITVAVSTLQGMTAQAAQIRADYAVNFYPPNPCIETSLGDLSRSTLGGALTFSYQQGRSGDPVAIPDSGLPAINNVACGSQSTGSFVFNLDLGVDATTLFLAFDGLLTTPESELPTYAFLPESDVRTVPEAAPLLNLGEISVNCSSLGPPEISCPNPGPPELLLYAFASPGHAMGSITVNFTQVPLPPALLLSGSSLVGLVLMRRKSTLK